MPVLRSPNRAMMTGMNRIGDRFQEGKAYLPDLLFAAKAMNAAMALLWPYLDAGAVALRGTAILGTVEGDVHEIGKNILINLLTPAGFEVHDLGVNVPASKFIAKAEEVEADIIAASAIMSTTMPFQKDIIDALESKGLRDKYLVMVGGGVVTQEWADKIGANGYADLASDGVKLATKLMEEKKGA